MSEKQLLIDTRKALLCACQRAGKALSSDPDLEAVFADEIDDMKDSIEKAEKIIK